MAATVRRAAEPLRLGVMGCASIARRRVLPAVARLPQISLAAVAGRDPHRTAELARTYGCRAVHGYAGLLDARDVDAVYVPLPAALHAVWIERALLAGVHVLAEKPLTGSAEQTARLLALAAGRGLVLMENVMFVHHRQHTTVRRLVARGAIGEVRALEAAFTVPAPPPGDIRYQAGLGGGALGDVGVYPLRAALHLLGPDLTVRGASLHTPSGAEVETAGAALLTTGDGVSAQLSFGMDHAYRSVYTVTGSTGRLTLRHAFTPPADHRPVVELQTADGPRAVTLRAQDQVVATLEAFAAAVRGTPGAAVGTADTQRQALLLDAVRQSSSSATALAQPAPEPASFTGKQETV